MSFDPSRGPETRVLLHTLCDESRRESACPTIPLSFVQDYPGHYRPAQLTALSFRELRTAMFTAMREGWPCFVILLHSFELVRPTGQRQGPLRPNRINVDRWDQLCCSWGSTATCSPRSDAVSWNPRRCHRACRKPPRTLPLDTAWRMAEQLVSRFI